MTTQTKHTPGPWVTGAGNFGLIKTEGSAGVKIAELRGDTARYPYAEGEQFANAKLIAAAPDLLAALVWLVETWPVGDITPEQINAARAAIAKAEGK